MVKTLSNFMLLPNLGAGNFVNQELSPYIAEYRAPPKMPIPPLITGKGFPTPPSLGAGNFVDPELPLYTQNIDHLQSQEKWPQCCPTREKARVSVQNSQSTKPLFHQNAPPQHFGKGSPGMIKLIQRVFLVSLCTTSPKNLIQGPSS